MSNTFAPFGFQQYAGLGSSPTYEQVRMYISPSYGTVIYQGDAVVPVTGSATGFIARATASTVALAGIFIGCKYLSISQKKIVWNPYFPASDVNTALNVEAYVINDPNARFKVQTGNSSTTATAVGISKIGQLINIGVAANNATGTGGGGSTANGQSQMYADQNTIGTTATLPFQIIDVIQDPPGANGADITSAYNWLIVGFNNAMSQGGGARTGIS